MPNPYDFVPFVGSVSEARKPPQHRHHRFAGHCGELVCTLNVLTPLFTAIKGGRDAERLEFPSSVDGRLTIVGSSLKGVIRNVAEAASASCIRLSGTLLDRQGQLMRRHEKRIEPDRSPCSQLDNLCPACRLFGMVGTRRLRNESDVQVFAGKVQIESALAISEHTRQSPEEMLITLMQPRDQHQSFYLKNGRLRGRKFYFHHTHAPQTDTRKSRYNKYIRPVLPGSQFAFSVHYQNLDDTELRLLLYSLTLEPTMAHKIGMGKPLGFGSARLQVSEAHMIEPVERYKRLGGGRHSLGANDIQGWIERQCQDYYTDQNEALSALRRILSYDPNNQTVYRYPGFDWFKENSQIPLEEAP